ncbi:thiamine pyrophosphate-dependent dehydrogenase E1 component subunit alpha [Salipiger sp.]|uniref:thiamine pyrophosphate-dependent dehydrogenase E1 component subunit alpha n=1 Tax=Salipiger sp. TaxID=2078585 RepID=UPI003A96D11F
MKNAPSPDDHLEMFRRMCLVRELEEELGRQHKLGKTRGPIHRCDGQEAVGVGVTAALRTTDKITTTHRGHAVYLGKGMMPAPVVAEIFGRATGACGGRAGHMLVADASVGMIGGNAIVGGSIPAAAGMALSIQVRGRDEVAVCVFGDGAAQTGICHEAMNMAGLWKLPVIFVLEHNRFGLTVPTEVQSAVSDFTLRAAGYGMPGVAVDGNDAVAVWRATAEAAERARRGEGPTLIVAETYRVEGFSTSDMGGYQSPEEIAAWKARDPIRIAFDALAPAFGAERLEALRADAVAEMQAAFAEAFAAPFPEFEVDTACAPYSTGAN